MPKSEEDIVSLNNMMEGLPETLALERVVNGANLKIGQQHVEEWIERHRRAKEIKKPLHCWGKDCKWGCDYYKLCEVDLRGLDRKRIIATDFTKSERKEEGLK